MEDRFLIFAGIVAVGVIVLAISSGGRTGRTGRTRNACVARRDTP